LAERRIQYGGNHGWAARAQNQLAELAAWLPGRLLDNGDRRQRFIAVMKLGVSLMVLSGIFAGARVKAISVPDLRPRCFFSNRCSIFNNLMVGSRRSV